MLKRVQKHDNRVWFLLFCHPELVSGSLVLPYYALPARRISTLEGGGKGGFSLPIINWRATKVAPTQPSHAMRHVT